MPLRTKLGRFVTKKRHKQLIDSNERIFGKNTMKIFEKLDENNNEIENESESESNVHVDVNTIENVVSGRRIVELKHLSKQLSQCQECDNLLNLLNTVGENRYGFGSVLKVMCKFCGFIYNIETNKRHRPEGNSRGPPVFDINTKAAVGIMHSGMGDATVNNFMAAVEIPSLRPKAMAKRRVEVGKHARAVAQDSCKKAIEEEKYFYTSSDRNNDSVTIQHATDTGAPSNLPTTDIPSQAESNQSSNIQHATDTGAPSNLPTTDIPSQAESNQRSNIQHATDTGAPSNLPTTDIPSQAESNQSSNIQHATDTGAPSNLPTTDIPSQAESNQSSIIQHATDTGAPSNLPTTDIPSQAESNQSSNIQHAIDTGAPSNLPTTDIPSQAESNQSSIIQHATDTGAPINLPTTDIPSHSESNQLNSTRISAEFSYDMCWQKRGSGRSYDSKSGVGTMIGNRSGKVCAYGVRMKDCRTCSVNYSKGKEIPKHKCVKNWSGSSKAMEPDVGAQCVKDIEKENVNVGVLIMDDDCTTIAKIRQELQHGLEKWSDINHTVKHLGSSLYNLAKKHKGLSTKVIKWIQKCFSYAVAQNKGNVDACRQAFQQIVPHAFSEHEGCGNWCGYLKNDKDYKHKSLPYGRDLTSSELRSDLDKVFSVLVQNVHKIAPGASTREVESFNNMLASKAPKRTHFSSTENLLNRVDCTVAQKNLGMSYVNKIYASVGLSPGRVFEEHAEVHSKTLKRKHIQSNSLEFKKRKVERKMSNRLNKNAQELREGVTYQTGIATTHMADVTEIPGPASPTLERLHLDVIQKCNQVFCDIETSSLHLDADILQIAAVCENNSFDQYITSTKSISPCASAVTGLTSQGNMLLYNNEPVHTLPLNEAITAFTDWLKTHQPCILVGHNFQTFDFPRLHRAFSINLCTDSLKDNVCAVVDTLPLFRTTLPGLEKYAQEYLVNKYVKEQYSAHNALGDVTSLQKLCTVVSVTDEQLEWFSSTTTSAMKVCEHKITCKANVENLHQLRIHNVVSKGMVDKLGKSGLKFEHLCLAVSRSGLQGLTQLLSEKINGKARVTSTKRIIESLYNFVNAQISK